MIDKLIAVLEQETPLREDTDMFKLEMPLGKSGLWIENRQIENPRTGYEEFDIYYRGKTKSSTLQNINFLKNKIEDIEECRVDGDIFRLRVLFTWDYLSKDAEGYYVFGNTLELF